jgi:uncharacterized membrane protein YvbJ
LSKFCPHCGKSLKEGYEFCIECGKPVYQDNTNKDIRSIGSQQKLKVDKKEKKESNYILNSSQRKILISKIFPILLFGSIIWLTSELIFSYFFSDFQYNSQFLIFQ